MRRRPRRVNRCAFSEVENALARKTQIGGGPLHAQGAVVLDGHPAVDKVQLRGVPTRDEFSVVVREGFCAARQRCWVSREEDIGAGEADRKGSTNKFGRTVARSSPQPCRRG